MRASIPKSSVPRGEQVANALTLALVCLGVGLRARGYLFSQRPLWLDEASWALRLIGHGYTDQYLRPLGFMTVSGALSWLFSPSERVLRGLPWFAGTAMVLVSPLLARRLFTGRAARLAFVAVLALHPAAIDFAKEFKPYSVSLCLHVALLLLTLRYVARARIQELTAALVLAFLGPFFAQDLVFAFPGTFIVLAWTAYERERSHLRWIGLCAGSIVAALVTQYLFIWRGVTHEEASYWGKKYGVFHSEADAQSYLGWLFERYRDLLEFPGERRKFWQSSVVSDDSLEMLRKLDLALWLLLHLAGLGYLALRKKIRELLLVGLPFVSLSLFNAFEFWPMGAFRTNLFALAYTAAIAAFALEWPTRALSKVLAVAAPVVFVLTPLVLFESDWHASKRVDCNDGDLPAALSRLQGLRRREAQPKRESLILGPAACSQWKYYARVHPDAEKFRAQAERFFDARCASRPSYVKDLERAATEGKRVWTIVDALDEPQSMVSTRRGTSLRVVQERAVHSLLIVAFEEAPKERHGRHRRRGSAPRPARKEMGASVTNPTQIRQ